MENSKESDYKPNLCILGSFGGGMSLAAAWPEIKKINQSNSDMLVIDPKGDIIDQAIPKKQCKEVI